MTQGRQLLRAAVLTIVTLALVAPIALGLWQTGRAAFGIFPAIGHDAFSLQPWHDLAALPGVATSLRLTLFTGIAATLVSLLLATGFCAAFHQRFGPLTGARLLTPALAIPHAALAVGLAFVLAPSGWIARLLAAIGGAPHVPTIATVHDAAGLALTLGLIAKEVPFLLLVMLSALTQIPVAQHLAAGRSLGYGPGIVWIKIIMPQIWPMIRMPVAIVLTYAMTVVDMALILGPSNPPTLAVAIARWYADPDPARILPASAGAILLALAVVAAMALLRVCEGWCRAVGRWWLRRGGRGLSWEPGIRAASAVVIALMALVVLAIFALLLWSVAWRWSFPHILPEEWSLRAWYAERRGWLGAMVTTLLLAAASVALALPLAIAWLESDDRTAPGASGLVGKLIFLPLLLPQIGFLYGLNVTFLHAGFSGTLAAVIWAHFLFVFPYVMIALVDPWRAVDPRLLAAAAALGAGPIRRLWSVRLPVLLRPILTATAIGIAVSVAQYLPTLFIGAGRVTTLTTEAVALSSGADRRITAVYATLQAALPLLAYLAAVAIPALRYRHRRDLLGAAAP